MAQSKVFPGEMSLTPHSLWIRTSSMDLPTEQSQDLLLGADYARIHEFLLEQHLEGNIVVILKNFC